MNPGELVIETALKCWKEGIRDPKLTDLSQDAEAYRARILTFYQKGAGWTWVKRYHGDSAEQQWCGMFAAYCWKAGGLSEDARKHYLPSTYRLRKWGVLEPGRQVKDYQKLHPGDIVVVGGDSGFSFGSHITLALGHPTKSGFVPTVEGNATGLGPHGEKFEGVVKRRRALTGSYRVRCAYRPLQMDLEE